MAKRGVDVQRLFREMEREAEEHGVCADTLDRPRMLRLWLRHSHLRPSKHDGRDLTRAEVDLARAALRRFTVLHMDAYAPHEPPRDHDDHVRRPRFLPIVLLPPVTTPVVVSAAGDEEARIYVESVARPCMMAGAAYPLLLPVEADLAPRVAALLCGPRIHAHVIEPWEWDDKAYVFVRHGR